jgi:hypothetical protein
MARPRKYFTAEARRKAARTQEAQSYRRRMMRSRFEAARARLTMLVREAREFGQLHLLTEQELLALLDEDGLGGRN